MTSSPRPYTAQEKKERIETAVMLTKNGRPRSLSERMVDYTIPGVSIAVINDYHLEWACGYGVRKSGESVSVDEETLFQACSISKAVTAIAVLRLVEEGRLDLDADVNLFLKSWKVPANGSWQPKVTVRQVLSHTAGISVPWFAGYHRDQDIPTLLEILSAYPNNPAISRRRSEVIVYASPPSQRCNRPCSEKHDGLRAVPCFFCGAGEYRREEKVATTPADSMI